MNALIPLMLCMGGKAGGLAPLVIMWALSQATGAKAQGDIELGRGKRKKKRGKKVIVPKKALRKLKAKAARKAGPPPASRTPTPDAEPNAAPEDEAPIEEVEEQPQQGVPEEIPFDEDVGTPDE